MQLLIGEFYRKISKFLNNMKWMPLQIIMRWGFYALVVIFLFLLGREVYRGNYLLIGIIIGAWALAEMAHYIRKSRENVMADKATEDNKIKEKKPKNKDLLSEI